MNSRCLIIDDEELAIRLLRSYIERVPFLTYEASTSYPYEAIELLKTRPVDLVFIDIEMPELTGLELIKSLNDPPSVIIVTAYREYAADAFDLDTVDYLVKPVSFSRFLKAVNKFRNLNANKFIGQYTEIQLKADRKIYKIAIHSILYIEGLKDYVKVFLDSGIMLIVKETMSGLMEKLGRYGFLRCHKSFIIPVFRVRAFSPDFVEISDKVIPIGRSFRETIISKLTQ